MGVSTQLVSCYLSMAYFLPQVTRKKVPYCCSSHGANAAPAAVGGRLLHSPHRPECSNHSLVVHGLAVGEHEVQQNMPRKLWLSARAREGGAYQKVRAAVDTTLTTVPVAEEAEPVTQKAKRQRRAPLTLQEEMALMLEWGALPCGPSGRKVGVHELEARWDLAHDHIRKNLLPRYADLEPGQMPKPRTLPGWTQSNKGVARKLLPSVMAEVEAKGDEWRNEWNFDEMAEYINKSGLLREGLSITAEGLRQRCHADGWDVWARPDQVPALSEQQMIDRMLFAFIYRNEDFRYWFDIDEKWFLCARLHARVKLGPGQKKPKRKAKNKKHLPKVMVLAGVASPRPGWNGKIGLWRAHKWVTVGRGNKVKGTKKRRERY